MKRAIIALASVCILILSSCATLDNIPSVKFNIENDEELSASKRYLAGYLDIDTSGMSFDEESLSETRFDGNALLLFRENSGSKYFEAYLPYQGPFLIEIPNKEWVWEHVYAVESKYAMGMGGIGEAVDYSLQDPLLIPKDSIDAGTVVYVGTLRIISTENGLGGKTYMIAATDESDDLRSWFDERFPSSPEDLTFAKRVFPDVMELQKKEIDNFRN